MKKISVIFSFIIITSLLFFLEACQEEGVTPASSEISRISITDVTVNESSNTVEAIFTITRTGGQDSLTVSYETADGTAQAGQDYEAKMGDISFAVGQNSATVKVNVLSDTQAEPNESFTLKLSGSSPNLEIADGEATATIVDAAQAPAPSAPDTWVQFEANLQDWKLSGTGESAEIEDEEGFAGHELSGDTAVELVAPQTLSFTFTGTRVALYGSFGPYVGGEADISIDGNAVATDVDWGTFPEDEVVVFVSDALSNTSHTIEIQAKGTAIVIDYLRVFTGPSQPTDIPTVRVAPSPPADYINASIPALGSSLNIAAGDIEKTINTTLDDDPATGKYIIHVPTNAKENMPLLFVIHGVDGTAAGMRDWTKMNETADREGFFAVYLESSSAWLGGADHLYILDVLAEVIKDYKIDEKRVYSCGFSAGGFMSHSLAMLFPDKFAAIVSVAGGIPPDYYPFPNTAPSSYPVARGKSIPVMFINNLKDQVVFYSPDLDNFWKEFHGITSSGVMSTQANGAVRQTLISEKGIEIKTFIYDLALGNGHGWPTTAVEGFQANDEIWSFVSKYRRGD